MSFIDEVKQWGLYTNSIGWNFNGRASRREYWMSVLFFFVLSFVANIVLGIVFNVLGGVLAMLKLKAALGLLTWANTILSTIIFIYITSRTLPLAVRRLHDIGKSGWTYLWCTLGSFICGIGAIVFLIYALKVGDAGDNQYGPNPATGNASY